MGVSGHAEGRKDGLCGVCSAMDGKPVTGENKEFYLAGDHPAAEDEHGER
jgi:hypothetical protein